MYTPIPLDSWPRKDHFAFFLDFEQPYFNVCVAVDMSRLYRSCKAEQVSFTAAYLYALQEAIADYEPMRYRIIERKPVIMPSVSLSVVTLDEQDAFKFVSLEPVKKQRLFETQFKEQQVNAHREPLFSETVQQNEARVDVSHVSILPWLNFTAFSHATNFGQSCGIPKCVFGRFNTHTGMTPLSIDVHHALMDGLHVAKFVDKLQKKLDELQVNG
ncbi:putative Chloramphenicol acetyltransferase [Pseudoalteromonas luteoviolacea B = ATCC 29581]|nr:putative Chloramphenicol acetyltransferase [Pseudoalteromonas luteoviolacea B = ATCC 29581]